MNIDEHTPQGQPVEPEKKVREKGRAGTGRRKNSAKKTAESGTVELDIEQALGDKPKTGRGRVKGEAGGSTSGRKRSGNAVKKEKTISSDPAEGNEQPVPAEKVFLEIQNLPVSASHAFEEKENNTNLPEIEELPQEQHRSTRVSIFFDRPLPDFNSVTSEKTTVQERVRASGKERFSFSEKSRNEKKVPAADIAPNHDEHDVLGTAENEVERSRDLKIPQETNSASAKSAERPTRKNKGNRGRSRKSRDDAAIAVQSEEDLFPVKNVQDRKIEEEETVSQNGTSRENAPEIGATFAVASEIAAEDNSSGSANSHADALPFEETADECDDATQGFGRNLQGTVAEEGIARDDNSVLVEHAGEGESLPPVTMEGLPQELRDAAVRAGWNELMPVQQNALPYGLAGRDLMVQSRTGSGKTGAFLLPLLARLEPEEATCQALVLVPTRELALQVEHEAHVLFEGTGLVSTAVYGGVGYAKQMEQLRSGAHLVVGTPGRVLDHLLKRTLNLDSLRALVFDESDRMLSIGFYPDMKEIQRYLPKRRIPTQLFSATYPPHVLRLSGEFLRNPHMLSLSQNQVHVAQIDHICCECATMEKDRTLVRLIEIENPSSAIIFCNTKVNVHYVTGVLQGFGYNADELSSDLSQNRREDVLGRLRKGEIRFLVATDVAARGIDIPELSHVFLYEPPEDHESYIHRAGRTGRAGAAGTVISIVDVMERLELQRIAKHYKIEIRQRSVPTDNDVSNAVGARVTAMLEARYRNLTGLQRERARRLVPLIRSMAADEDLLNLLGMLLDNSYQEPTRLPVPATNMRPNSGVASRSTASGIHADTPSASQKSSRRRRRRKPLRSTPASE